MSSMEWERAACAVVRTLGGLGARPWPARQHPDASAADQALMYAATSDGLTTPLWSKSPASVPAARLADQELMNTATWAAGMGPEALVSAAWAGVSAGAAKRPMSTFGAGPEPVSAMSEASVRRGAPSRSSTIPDGTCELSAA